MRDVIHIDDVCEIILIQIKKIRKYHNLTFNIGGDIKNSVSLKSLTKKCEHLTQNKIKIGRTAKTSIYDIPYFITDNKKVTRTYGWKPKKKINNIVQDIYKWMSLNKGQIKKFL